MARGGDITDEEFGAVVGEAEGREPWARDVVSRWLAGKRVPRKATRAAMARLVGLTLDEFDGWSPDGAMLGRPGLPSPSGKAAAEWLTPSLRRWLRRFLRELQADGATAVELWAAEQLLTHQAVATFFQGEVPRTESSASTRGGRAARTGRPRRGIPDVEILAFWRAVGAHLRDHLAKREP